MIFYHRDTEAHERAAIMQHDGGLTKEEAERATAAQAPGIICAGCLKRVVVPIEEKECPECAYLLVRN